VTIAVDAMGGDYAPRAVVRGAVKASVEFDEPVLLVGDRPAIEAELGKMKRFDQSRVSIKHSTRVVGMNESPSHALRHLADTSIEAAWGEVRAGRAQAVVSCGHSGATMAFGLRAVGRLPGVDRPALAAIWPTASGPVVMADVGANMDCSGEQLFQFGVMSHVFARLALGIENPQVGLINIGREENKGNEPLRRAYRLLSESGLPFVGNIEGKDIFSGLAQVAICDGFVGNVLLKFAEGWEMSRRRLLSSLARRDKDKKSWRGYLMMKPVLRRHHQVFDYAEYGGAPLLGLGGLGLVCHGSSTAKAVKNAVGLATVSLRQRLVEHLREGLRPLRHLMSGPKRVSRPVEAV
jgi:glycerol-3-phosphate acyltransferase PlsX